MKRGLVIGKFLPVHNGHIALIDFAAAQCDELIVSMSYTMNDTIDPTLRLSWLKEIFAGRQHVVVNKIEDNFDDDSLPWHDRTKIWATVIRQTYPRIDILFSSEQYGPYFASNLGTEHVLFDQNRNLIPVSATLIRDQPIKYWQFIPQTVRPYFVKKVCLYGAESTGKSVMSKLLAAKYETVFVPEVACEILSNNDFTIDDIIMIGYAQYERLKEKSKEANKILFCDTDCITTQIYSDYYLHTIPPVLYELEAKVKYDHYFLFDVDVLWVADGLRDLGDKRALMFNTFKEALDKRAIPYTLVRGSYAQREQIISAVVDALFNA